MLSTIYHIPLTMELANSEAGTPPFVTNPIPGCQQHFDSSWQILLALRNPQEIWLAEVAAKITQLLKEGADQ